VGQALILEIIDPRGRVRQRVRLAEHPLTIGRGYRNDLILDDPYVDPNHLRIEGTEGGDWVVTDLGSKNGTWDGYYHRRVSSQLLQAGTEVRIGRTTIRAVGLDHAVPAALTDPAHQVGPVRRLVDPWVALLATAFAIGVSTTSRYLASASQQGFVDLATPGLAILAIAIVWATAWAFTNRIVAQRFNFLGHLGWAMVLGTAFGLTTTLFEWIRFFAPALEWVWAEVLAEGGLFAVLLAGHLQLVTEWSAARQWRVAVLAAGLVVGVGVILNQSSVFTSGESERVAAVPLKPIAGRLVPAASIDQFFRATRGLQRIVDDLAGDEPPG
jgi:hypothetical protein